MARITALEPQDGFVSVLGLGARRVDVVEWLADDPYPLARARNLPPLEWDDALESVLEDCELVVRRTLARASEFDDHRWTASVNLADDPIARSWQLAAIAPVGPLDQQTFLRSSSTSELLNAVGTATSEVAEDLDGRAG